MTKTVTPITYEQLPLYCGITGFEGTLTKGGACPLCNHDIMSASSDYYYDHIVKGA